MCPCPSRPIFKVFISLKKSRGNYSVWADELSNAKKAIARGASVFASPWTPPASMKSNSSTIHGSLNTSSYASYASYLKSFANYFSNNGASLYAISLQNEPDWDPDYEGCTWTAAQFYTFLKNYGSTIAGSAKIIMPESLNFNHSMSDTTLNDSTAASYVSIIGGHLYGGTIQDYALARAKGKELWMTEHLLNDQTLSACLTTAKEIHDCMTVANMNAYVWWWVISDANGFFSKTTGAVQKRGYVVGQFAKFVRPGYYRVTATSNPQANVYVSAYKGNGKVAIVAINNGTSAVSQNFVLQNGTTSLMSRYVTSSSQNIATSASLTVSGGSFTANLPAQSVTTLVGDLETTT
jgi:glucuronoarabinoxylan endo-1,4-beta-xylanase